MRVLLWTHEALEDREAIYGHIEADNPAAAALSNFPAAARGEWLRMDRFRTPSSRCRSLRPAAWPRAWRWPWRRA